MGTAKIVSFDFSEESTVQITGIDGDNRGQDQQHLGSQLRGHDLVPPGSLAAVDVPRGSVTRALIGPPCQRDGTERR